MSKDNVLKFSLPVNQVYEEIAGHRMPTAIEAYEANQKLIYLQQIFPMLRTAEEKENNLIECRDCLEIMSAFILVSYVNAKSPESTH